MSIPTVEDGDWNFEPELEFVFAEQRDPKTQAELERQLDEYDEEAES